MNRTLCLFTAEFPFALQETFLENEIQYLSESFDQVYIVPLFKHAVCREVPFSNVKVMTPVNSSRRPSIHKAILFLHPTFWKVLISGIFEIGIEPQKIRKIIKQALIVARLKKYIAKRSYLSEADLWYFYWGTNSISVLPFLKDHPKAIARYHRYDLYGSDCRKGEIQVFQEKAAARLRKAFFVARDGENYFKQKYGNYSKVETVVSKLGVPCRGVALSSNDGVLRIVSCSNLYLVKRVELIAKALLKISCLEVDWTHFGDGVDNIRDEVLKITSLFGRNIKFNFVGRVRNTRVIAHYQENPVDLFINVSESEGLPVSIMEALSFGVPVMATGVGGVPELVNSNNGYLLSPDINADELARSIQNFYRDCYGDEGKRTDARRTWQSVVNAEPNYTNFVSEIKKL